MKLLVVLAGFVTICASSALPEDIPRDNSHYVEGESRYAWVPDGDGELYLVDLHQPDPTEAFDDGARRGSDNQYWLFTRQNMFNRQVIQHNNINSIRNSNYRANRGLVVLVHGWNGNGNNGMSRTLTTEFLNAMDVNVIVVDWNRLANKNYYPTSARGVPDVGNHIGDFLVWLIQQGGGNWNSVHLVGFSLGAHAVGQAGRRAGRRAARVTGLDPAGPLWGGNANRLQSNSGVYVEAIHTDGRALGIMDRSGDADFYPNGGRHQQPGCRGGVNTSCSHSRAYEFFQSSVRQSNRFVGIRCNDLNQVAAGNCNGPTLHMGNGVFGKRGSGIFHLRTGASFPF